MVYETVVDWEYEQKCSTSYEEECHGYGYHQECEQVYGLPLSGLTPALRRSAMATDIIKSVSRYGLPLSGLNCIKSISRSALPAMRRSAMAMDIICIVSRYMYAWAAVIRFYPQK